MTTASSPSDPCFDPRAQDLYFDFRRRAERGEKIDFEDVCAAHPEHAAQLREMKSLHAFAVELASNVFPADTIFAPLRERYGESVKPSPALDDEPEPDSAAESSLLEKLRAEGPRGTRYKLLGEIAHGGMGAIIRVRDGELNRTLAMKVILGQRDPSSGATPDVDPKVLGRFLEEAQITGQLDHPGIVPVHELGLDRTGRVYFTMKLVKGEDLKTVFEHVKSGHDGWNQVRALGVILRVCEAMAFAHSKKVVHRDLKPANVMVGKFGEVYVMDWGLARVLGREDKHDLRLKPQGASSPSVIATERRNDRESTPDSPLVTMDGDVVGTPSFMPPEQAKGQLDKLGPHSDVYSIGAMLYQLVTGQMPYVPAGARVSQRTILDAVLRRAPDAIESLAPSTPPELVAVCDRAMERDIARRYPDTLALAADLRAYLEGRVVAAYETGAWAETKKWVQRNKPLTVSLAGSALALLGGIVFSLRFAREANDERERTDAANTALEVKNAALRAQSREQKLRGMIQELARLRAQCRTLDGLDRMGKPAYLWWIEESEKLLLGQEEDLECGIDWRPGLKDVQAKIAELRASDQLLPYIDEDRQRDFETHPDRAELRELERTAEEYVQRPTRELADLETRVRSHALRLGKEPWPSETEVTAKFAQELQTADANKLDSATRTQATPENGRAFAEDVVRAMLFARRDVEVAGARPVALARVRYAWSLLYLGRHDEAIVQCELALTDAPNDYRNQCTASLDLVRKEVARWSGAQLSAREAEFAQWTTELDQLRASLNADSGARRAKCDAKLAELRTRCGERRTWAFNESQLEWWHSLLVTLEADLRRLEMMYAVAIEAHLTDKAKDRWSEAIEGIAKAREYAGQRWPSGERLTPQLGLLPLGSNPATGLWEFVHLQTGAEPRLGPDGRVLRDAEGRLTLTPETGLVFVLLPDGRVPKSATEHGQLQWITGVDLWPFFLSKYEMTHEQWDRLSLPSGVLGHNAKPLIPANGKSWDDTSLMLQRAMGWCGFPSEAQWEYGCRAGTTTARWTGNDETAIASAANFGEQIQPIGQLRANAFGLHDVYGNVSEWCGDTWDGAAPPRIGDGLRDDGVAGSVQRSIRGESMGGAALSIWSAHRRGLAPTNRFGYCGVRPAGRITP